MNITLCLTHDCNLRCRYCYAGRKFARSMSWEVAQRAIDIGLAGRPGLVDLSFFGGEPLLEFPMLQRCVAYARERAAGTGTRLRLQVTTNATLLTEEIARWLRAESFYVGISLDGVREAHDAARRTCGGASSFDAALRGLDIALAQGLRLEVIAVVDPANVRWLAESAAFLADRGVPKIALNPNFSGNWTDDTCAELERQYARVVDDWVRRYREGRPAWVNFVDGKIITRLKRGFSCRDKCGLGGREIAVAPSGNFYPCERLVADDTDAAMVMGTVFDGIDPASRQRYTQRSTKANPACDGCALRDRCMNWCGCTNYMLTGDIDVAGGALCWHEQVAIREADRAGAILFAEGNPSFLREYYRMETPLCV